MKTELNDQGKNELREYLDTIPVGEIKELVQKMIDETKTTHYIFKNWKRGITKTPLLEQTVINRVSMEYNGKEVFNLGANDTDQQHEETR